MRKFISLISLIVFLAPSLVLAKAAKTAPGAPSVKSTGESASGGGQVLQNIDPPDIDASFQSVPSIVSAIFDIAIAVGGVVFVVLFLIGGVMYLTNAGNDEQTKKAKQLLIDAVIGMVIIVIAWAVGNYVLGLLGIGSIDIGG